MYILSALALACTTAQAQGLPTADPEDFGFSPERLQRIDIMMQDHVDQKRLAGAVSAVVRQGQLVHMGRYGARDLESGAPMEFDTVFQIWSMTRPVTSVAAMLLYEEGYFQLDDPVAQYIPSFAGLQVYKDSTEAGIELVDTVRPVTVRDLFTHTAGLTYGWIGNTPVHRIYSSALASKSTGTLAEMIPLLTGLPLLYQPGQGREESISMDVLGYLIEVLSGMPLDLFFEKRIFEPLGMMDTAFFVPQNRLERAAIMYRQDEAGRLKALGPPRIDPPIYLSGSGGLVSTASDYLRFCQMLMGQGELENTRLLSRKTVELMTVNHLPAELLPYAADPNAQGYGWGLGFAVMVDLAQSHAPGSVGEFRWDGGANTFFWVDPQEEIVGLLLIQKQPWDYRFYRQFKVLVYQALID
jgi:CubicO group peptidase (beta-lactamase class C family)